MPPVRLFLEPLPRLGLSRIRPTVWVTVRRITGRFGAWVQLAVRIGHLAPLVPAHQKPTCSVSDSKTTRQVSWVTSRLLTQGSNGGTAEIQPSRQIGRAHV